MAVLGVTTTAALAQSRGMGRVMGVVVDESGAPVADVAIRTATATGTVLECRSDDHGKWVLAGVGRGEWIVSFTKVGFAVKRVKAIVEREIDRSDPIKITLAKST
jgi:hypothetical protein